MHSEFEIASIVELTSCNIAFLMIVSGWLTTDIEILNSLFVVYFFVKPFPPLD